MSLRRTATLLTTAAALALPAAASAAPPWSAPATIPGAAPSPAPLLVTKDGRALAFPAADRSSAAPPGAATEVVPLDPATGAPAGTIRGISIAGVFAETYARNRVVIAGSTLDADGTISDKSHVQVAYGTGGGDLGPLRGLTDSTGEHAFGLAANDDGVVALVLGNAKERRLLIRRPDGAGFRQAFQTSVTNQGRAATVAVGATGDVLMLWEDQHHVYARHVGPSGSVGARHLIGDGVQSRLQAAVEAGGRLMAAWASQRVSEGESNSPVSVFFATAAPGHGFGKARLLEQAGPTGTGRYVSDPAVRLVTGGASLIAWTGYDQATQHFTVRAAPISGGHVAAPQTVSGTAVNAVLGDVGVDVDGTAAVLWRTGVAGADADGTPQQLVAATRPSPAVAFGAPETVAAPADGGTLPFAPVVALAPSTGAVLAEYGAFAGSASLLRVAARPAP